MSQRFSGIEASQEQSAHRLRPDTRRFSKRSSEFFNTTDGVLAAMFGVPVMALLLMKVPLASELLLLAMVLFYRTYVSPGKAVARRGGIWWLWDRIFETEKVRKIDFPYRVPSQANAYDGSMPRERPSKGKGITFLGHEISSKLGIYSSDSDLRTHMLVLGTTGSGKTEFLLGLVYNALIQNSGFIYTDGKGDVALWNNVFRLARYIGREYDLVLINFLTSGRDFLDKQTDRTTNTMNPFALGSSGMLIELIISLMDDSGGGGDMWKGRAIAFVAGLTRALTFLRDRGYLLLEANTFMDFMKELPVIERMCWDKKIPSNGEDVVVDDPLFDKVLEPLRAFVLTLPGYNKQSAGGQEQKTLEQYGFITMQLTRLFSDLSYTYGHIFQTSLSEVDMYDVVINRRILVVLLPALERAPDSLKMLGKMIVGAIKQMMAGCLGNRVEGAVREIVYARPTNASVPYYVVLDEYGYYAVLGFAVAPAQARSLGFPQPETARVRMADGTHQTMGEMAAGDMIRLPTGGAARVSMVLKHGLLPVSRVTLNNGRSTEAANVHSWPTRVRAGSGTGAQHLLLSTAQMRQHMKNGDVVELSYVTGDGAIEWAPVASVVDAGIRLSQCLVVDDPMHCYITDGELVTHNCITFAAQDFSSLQKASKEEADATWENTNVRAVGRLTSGEESETFKRIVGAGGEAFVYEESRKTFDAGHISSGYRAERDVAITKAKRITYNDLAHQQDGEFTFIIGKKASNGSDGVRVVRAMSFFTQTFDKNGKPETPSHIRVNHFLKVAPPAKGGGRNDDPELIEEVEQHFIRLLTEGKIKDCFSTDPAYFARTQKTDELFKASQYIRKARDDYHLSLSEAVRVALVCCEQEGAMQARRAAERTAELQASRAGAVATDAPADAALQATVRALAEDSDALSSGAASASTAADLAAELEAELAGGIAMTEGDSNVHGDDDMPRSLSLDNLGEEDGALAPAAGAVRMSFGDEEDVVPVPRARHAASSSGSGEGESQGTTQTDTQATGAGGAQSSGGGGGMAMALTPAAAEPAYDDRPMEVQVASAVVDFINNYQFPAETAGEGSAVESVAPKSLSLLTLRPLGEGEEPPSEVSSYLTPVGASVAGALADADVALGAAEDPLEARARAGKDVRSMENATAYVEGSTPDPVTQDEFDDALDALVEKASTYRMDVL
ncbi:FtsK/SpoIIIE domain-containing protein [Cupriavidus sp. TMH.W2]|uniref:FtsK/SpoIIIE domain-containing protein n=1 Tax=Cupriavidus sp. TMH.W2 TaxID=3434465 RepID=UPI003D77FA7F